MTRSFFSCAQTRGGVFAMLRLSAQVFLPAAICVTSGAVLAQGADCNGLRAQIAALDQASARSNPYAGAAQRQRADLQRSMAYAHSLGCDHQQFLFFGAPPPPQCGALNAQIQEKQARLGEMEANAHGAVDSPQRRQLMASYNYYCHGEETARGPRGFFESLFGGQRPADVQPAAPPPDVPLASEQPGAPQGGSEVLCVRHCDGGFFPLNYSPGRGSQMLTDFCKASCPNTEVSVYTRVPGEEIQTAVGLDGEPYMDLPTALKYQKSLDPSCSCRATGASWAETLADAESMLNHNSKDVLVTPEKSAEMAQPKPDPAQKTKADAAAAKAPQSNDDIEATDAAAAAQVPTAGTDSAGIATGDVKHGTAYPQGKGQTVEVTGADGVKRRVRIVGPQL